MIILIIKMYGCRTYLEISWFFTHVPNKSFKSDPTFFKSNQKCVRSAHDISANKTLFRFN